MSDYWRHVEEIFHQALDVPADARPEFLREHCGGDLDLEKEVREILESYDVQDRLSTTQESGSGPGTRFGAFEVIRKIGEGGMGTVYLARRQEDFEQQAAIKVIGGSPAGVALMVERFRQERQILAGLDHPNIARLLDGGVTKNGEPYLVMEYVEGVRLDRYCDAHGLTIRQRLELFRKICAAVHFAHQHLVIHRDLKPGNILVNELGEPKLLDFGIAKVLAEPGSSPDQTMTMTGSLLLTPQYASPEQIRGLSCTVASDVYSLGVILYELLAGRGPYKAATPAEFIAAVVTEEVQRPSLTAPQGVKTTLEGDLDGIVMKALAKLPEDRYGTVEQLSEDIRRHWEGLPVSAVEGTRLYIARKFVQRHRIGVGAAMLILLSLLAGLGATLWQARVAEQARASAEQRFSDARKLANYLLFPLYDSVQSLPGSLRVRADMAAQSLQYLDRLAAAKSKDHALRTELAEGYVRLGTILEAPLGSGDSLGNTAKAVESAGKALAILEPLNQEDPKDIRVQQDLARAYRLQGSLLNLHERPQEGVARLNQSVAIFDRLAASQPYDAARQMDAGQVYMALADVLSSPGGGYLTGDRKDQVMAACEKAIAHFEAALAISPSEDRAPLGIARAYQVQGSYLAITDPWQGMTAIRKGLGIIERLPRNVRDSPDSLTLEAKLTTLLAHCQDRMRQPAEALATLDRPREILDRFAAQDPKNSTNERRRASLYELRARMEWKLGRKPEALADYRKVIEIWDGLVAVDPSRSANLVIRAEAQGMLAKLLAGEGRRDEAAKYAKASIASLEELADRPDATEQFLCEASIVLMVTPVPSLRDYPRALRYARRADELAKGKGWQSITYLAMAYANNGDARKALETVKRGLAIVPPPPPGKKPSTVRQNLEDEFRDIEILAKTGKLPPDFNQ